MSLIEQAAKRLEELRRAGVEVPEVAPKLTDVPEQTPNAVEAPSGMLKAAPTGQPRKQRSNLGAVPPAPRSPATHEADESRQVHVDLAHLAGRGVFRFHLQRCFGPHPILIKGKLRRFLLLTRFLQGDVPRLIGFVVPDFQDAKPQPRLGFGQVGSVGRLDFKLDETVIDNINARYSKFDSP